MFNVFALNSIYDLLLMRCIDSLGELLRFCQLKDYNLNRDNRKRDHGDMNLNYFNVIVALITAQMLNWVINLIKANKQIVLFYPARVR